jgi:hypothetical protein
MIDRTRADENIAIRVPLRQIPADGRPGVPSSAKTAELLNRPVNLAIRGLTGCTPVVVISRGGVWMSHFWENPSFESGPEQFIKEVLDPMDGGDGTPSMPGIRPLTSSSPGTRPGRFSAVNQPLALIISPNAEKSDNENPSAEPPNAEKEPGLAYGDEVGQIETRLRQITGNDQLPIRRIGYKAADAEKDRQTLRTTAAGKVLFQYDPNQRRCGSTQRAAVKVWLQDNQDPILQEDWDALDFQQVSGNRKRDSCPLSPSQSPKTVSSTESPASKPISTSKTDKPNSLHPTSKPAPPTKVPPSSPSSSGKPRCKVDVRQELGYKIGDRPVYFNVTITAAEGGQIGSKTNGAADWGQVISVKSKLAGVLKVTAQLGPKGSSSAPYNVETGVVDFSIGKQSWDTTSKDCTVGDWRRALFNPEVSRPTHIILILSDLLLTTLTF